MWKNILRRLSFYFYIWLWRLFCTLEKIPEGEGVVFVTGQDSLLQASVTLACPTQFFPPFVGTGSVQLLSLCRVPPPQLLVQVDQDANLLHCPSTWAWNQLFKTFQLWVWDKFYRYCLDNPLFGKIKQLCLIVVCCIVLEKNRILFNDALWKKITGFFLFVILAKIDESLHFKI